MTLTARATKSIRIRDVAGQRSGAIGFTKLLFAGQATGGEATLDLTALTTPTGYGALGYVQPTVNQLQSADIKFYRKNLTLRSSVRGPLNDYDDYVVTNPMLITFQGFVLQSGEIITGVMDKAPMPGLVAVDNTARPMNYTLLAGQVTVPVGWPFEVAKFPTVQVGAIMVFVDGWLQMRCVGNTFSGEGNYKEILASTGLGNTIEFKAAFAEDRQIMVIPVMAAAVAPSASLIAYLDSLNGVVAQMAEDLAQETGNPLSRYQVAPSGVDLAAFGARVTALDTVQLKTANYIAVAGDQILADTSPAFGPWVLTLPAAPTVGQRVTVWDAKRQFAINNLTIASTLIEGVTQTYTCDVEGMKVEFTYVDATYGWNVSKLVP